MADLDFQEKSVRFLENHDEPRAAATFPLEIHRPAAIITFLTPGLRFFHQGQFEGRKIRISVHLGRGPAEPPDDDVAKFYAALLECLKDPVFREGNWRQLECRPAWEGNWSCDSFVIYAWSEGSSRRLVIANYSDRASQCYVTLPWTDLEGRQWQLRDRMGSDVYERDGHELATRGFYLDMPAWGYHLFDVQH